MARSRNVSSNTVVRDRPPSFGLVHGRVGVSEERFAGVAIGGVGDADARREEQLVPIDGDRPFEDGVDPRGQYVGVDAIRFAMQEDELVPDRTGR